MAKNKTPQTYFSSDWHMNHYSEWTGPNGEKLHRGIVDFERHQFKTIQEHDKFIEDMIIGWSEKWTPGSTLYYLGDFGDIKYLWLFDVLRSAGMRVVFLYGNHDSESDYEEIALHVDEIHRYPIFLSKKLVISHEPVAVYEDTINVHGHLHGSVLRDKNHINVSLHVVGYKPITMQYVNNRFSDLPKYTRRFLYEPFAADMVFTQPKDDVIMDKNGRIDLSASRLLLKMNTEKRVKNGEPYRPYVGGIK